jgi:hypothetical protein
VELPIILKNINSKIFYYFLVLIRHPLLLFLIMIIIYILLFIYFFADPILCTGSDKTQESLRDPEISERLKELKALSESYAQQFNEKLNALNALYDKDMDKFESASGKYEY